MSQDITQPSMDSTLGKCVIVGVCVPPTDGSGPLGQTQHRDADDAREAAGGKDGEGEAGG